MSRSTRILTAAVAILVVARGGSRASDAGPAAHGDAGEQCAKQLFIDVHELAPGGVTPEAARATHREAHGLQPDRILEVTQGE